MPIKFEVDMEAFTETVRHNEEPLGFGDLVFAWDKDTTLLAIGVHYGFDNYYDPDTGDRVRHRHKVLVLSWTDQVVTTFDDALSIPLHHRLRRVITEFGTGNIVCVTDPDKSIDVVMDNGDRIMLDIDAVKLFDWGKVKDAYEKNDKPTA